MILKKCDLNLNKTGKELQPQGTIEFPCATYSKIYTDLPGDFIPWHWHEEMEIVYVKEGSMYLHIPSKVYHLKKGDCVIINANISHYGIATPKCHLQSFVFSPNLISGNNDFVFSKKYLLPLITCSSFDWYLLKEKTHKTIINNFISAFRSIEHNISGYEFIIRNKLSNICFFLYQQFVHEIEIGNTEINQDHFRIKKMLGYIHDHFSNNISLNNIAEVTTISERECLRCFQRTLQVSPIQYLLKYRIMQGALLLSDNPLLSISEIASITGFNSPSSFSKFFKRFYSCTPKEYRKNS